MDIDFVGQAHDESLSQGGTSETIREELHQDANLETLDSAEEDDVRPRKRRRTGGRPKKAHRGRTEVSRAQGSKRGRPNGHSRRLQIPDVFAPNATPGQPAAQQFHYFYTGFDFTPGGGLGSNLDVHRACGSPGTRTFNPLVVPCAPYISFSTITSAPSGTTPYPLNTTTWSWSGAIPGTVIPGDIPRSIHGFHSPTAIAPTPTLPSSYDSDTELWAAALTTEIEAY
ncbi:hypothetical protein C8Q77DRAFT_551097 [Trametes polyzona]|nr:hypothetical protein C8Q77DRAFT_551097 [Trametes polyzona]